ncbi:betaine aldehyde dehydrogenase [Magnaporthiopsis poae ATCC 64411]|uniref:aldehyde dehydrogenase (NAD(+)) n=1 Tax=Magnaporthiopsis poae (strain ATCC 64411 / 73-15) TaxID=644358 RepID=A0A0C4EBN6_MAGP6|nr:betaine aldehyde dehydrogenase [Magnaporthiopsis poae ATCC 64411]
MKKAWLGLYCMMTMEAGIAALRGGLALYEARAVPRERWLGINMVVFAISPVGCWKREGWPRQTNPDRRPCYGRDICTVGNGRPPCFLSPAASLTPTGSCHAASAEDVNETVDAAHAAFRAGVWSRAPRQTRADVLDRAAELLGQALPGLIDLEVRQTGRAVREMRAQVPSLVRWFRYYAALLRTEQRAVLPTTGALHNWDKAASIERRMGSPANPASMMGPLVSARQLAGVEALVDEAVASGNARPLCGGARMTGRSALDSADLSRGYFFPPTVLASASDTKGHPPSILSTRLWREEAFGPVVVVCPFDDEDEAVALANDSAFGLGAAVWTRDLSRAFRVSDRVDAGIVWVNTHHRNDPSSPWGAHGARPDSGLGSENGVDAYLSYTAAKSVIINYAPPEAAVRDEDWFREEGGDVRYG